VLAIIAPVIVADVAVRAPAAVTEKGAEAPEPRAIPSVPIQIPAVALLNAVLPL